VAGLSLLDKDCRYILLSCILIRNPGNDLKRTVFPSIGNHFSIDYSKAFMLTTSPHSAGAATP
jgi:hypothetical protein